MSATDTSKNLTLPGAIHRLRRLTQTVSRADDYPKLKEYISNAYSKKLYAASDKAVEPLSHAVNTAIALCEMVSPDRNMCLTVLLEPLVNSGFKDIEVIADEWGDDVAGLLKGRLKVASLYGRRSKVDNENFGKLLLTFADDIRVIIIMIVDRMVLMRAINRYPDREYVRGIAAESSYLYAPLAHRLGLYKIKSELEDMSLKYTNRDIYTRIAHGLNAKKSIRDAYIADFIAPIREKLEATGLKFEIKGRTKSIYSIWNKLRKQQIEMKDIFDLFAIRIILDVPPEREKPECWNVYSMVTDMYTPNPARLKDWLSIPKSNGYESLHTTVKGPDNKWVEVQIRTKRMDLIAEKGLAAHWRYKGIKSQGNLDQWMNNIRDILEAPAGDPMELMKDMKMDLYEKEVFIFTPKGDLFKLPLGATVLDFAFAIHTKLGCICTGGRVNGRNRKLNFKLQSGDTVEIITSSTQQPKLDWLNFLVTSKARSKVRQAVKERENRAAELGKEMLQRRCKNRKTQMRESVLMKLIKKLGYKTVTDFYSAIGNELLEPNDVIARYDTFERSLEEVTATRSAEEFELQSTENDDTGESGASDDVIVIGENVKGISYRLARCCNPIHGDDVFGFVSAEGVVKIHRRDCPNAAHIISKYPYRFINTRWAGKLAGGFGATLKVVGIDDIGIVTNISSIINKETSVALRNISIDSFDGLFRGFLVISVENTSSLENIIKKIKTVKGVKDVQRSN